MPIETNQKENFLRVNDAVNNIVCFATKTNLKTLCLCRWNVLQLSKAI
jgi:hypothetical protein